MMMMQLCSLPPLPSLPPFFQIVGEYNVDDSKKMTTERCATLITAAIAHKLDQVWISKHPILLFAYVAQYTPSLMSSLGVKLGQARVNAFRSGEKNINAGFFSALFGSKKTQ